MAMDKKIRVSVVGATGYAGVELVRLLLGHPGARLHKLSSVSFEGRPISDVYPALRGVCDDALVGEAEAAEGCDVLFASLPAGLSEPLARRCYDAGTLFIDLGADFRLHDEEDYRAWYGKNYADSELHGAAVYAIPELFRDAIRGAKIIGNPGCYPTSAALGLAPALRGGFVEADGIVIDAKSGVTGAGRSPTQTSHFPECNEAFSPYKVAAHRHTPEIEQTLSVLAGESLRVTFVPHLLPLNRGIVSTIYTRLKSEKSCAELVEAYRAFYAGEPFVRVQPEGTVANLRNVRCSNYCDVSLHVDARTNRLIVVSAIDNMVKGAAGQAIQNMNVALGLPEADGLGMIPPAI